MPIDRDRLRLSYFPIPKNGTSTLRAVFRAIEAGDNLDRIRTRGRKRGGFARDRGAGHPSRAARLPGGGHRP